ncbi:MAG TPA: hypothetical protein VEB68_01630 [Croceibacterium sp.]|nr:hypothetical protein [Croceibacterium sp.]
MGGTNDQLGLQGHYVAGGSGTIAFGATQLTGIEMIVCITGGDGRLGNPPVIVSAPAGRWPTRALRRGWG